MDLFSQRLSLLLSVAVLVLIASTGLAATIPETSCFVNGIKTETIGADSSTRVADIGATHLWLSRASPQCAATDVAVSNQSTLFYGDVAGGDTNTNNNMAINIAQSHRTSVMGVVAGATGHRRVVSRPVWMVNARTARQWSPLRI